MDKVLNKRLANIEKSFAKVLKGVSFLSQTSAREFKRITTRFNETDKNIQFLASSVDSIKKIIINGRFDKRIERLEYDVDKMKDMLHFK
ncbi:MAG: hypothetical protein A3I39_00135 [Candidatus Yanofskybacteria bacterium RIFCSPLOWO2_02_FULL_47_9b]|uniref:Uncharacterized protein n=1 Tax=Candidatus Yanofskybacteria bacterium RIFCSPLOWO2_02_FULL_47_9b TaxID=1802708 RepID=A0A1F8HCQ2_9BACT|nr:MAG: hypothetical protein A3I39_00135 [Candidatus Yanofskybacteria bacterium RIFCSPLOWO2_02_FULL_47_9b]